MSGFYRLIIVSLREYDLTPDLASKLTDCIQLDLVRVEPHPLESCMTNVALKKINNFELKNRLKYLNT